MATTYYFPMFARLEPRTPWSAGRLADTDILTLEEAVRLASKHADTEITVGDFLRAGARGEILLRAIVHRTATIKPTRPNDVLINAHTPGLEGKIPAGAIPTLPITACVALANAGVAYWRTLDGWEPVPDRWAFAGDLGRFTRYELAQDEPDFTTTPADCRVTGYDVHALADAFQELDEAAAVPEHTAAKAAEGPLPLTTGEIAHSFAGLRWKTESAWKKPLGDKPKWLKSCIAIPGRRGVSETRWNPVAIGAALVSDGFAQARSVRARFQTMPLLMPWLEAWKNYEAEYLDTD